MIIPATPNPFPLYRFGSLLHCETPMHEKIKPKSDAKDPTYVTQKKNDIINPIKEKQFIFFSFGCCNSKSLIGIPQ